MLASSTIRFGRRLSWLATRTPRSIMTSIHSLHNEVQDTLHNEAGIEKNMEIERNFSPALLYEHALRYEKNTFVSSTGALIASSGEKTGRCPKDKRIVEEDTTVDKVWWGPVNIKMSENVFMINRERAVDYLNTRERLYVFDGFAGWDPEYRIKVRVVCARAYHALFMHNMLIRPTESELKDFGHPDFTIYNAGQFTANRYTTGMSSTTSVAINFKKREMAILGTEYAGEMKKGVFTIMHYLMPVRGVLSLHSSANEGPDGDVTLFFGLSGTGKTTLSADPARRLIGDDEHCWSDRGVFNIEGGCYAKCIDLSREKEPAIFDAIRYGAILENVEFNPDTRVVSYDSKRITENTRCAYPIEHIPNAKIPCVGTHPSNIIMLTCDAFGVLPPVSRLTPEQAMYHFISGYTAKMSGTEEGITEPSATFSACFGQPFIVLHPMEYAKMLAEKMRKHKANAWLINTGWHGGSYGIGSRIALKYSRLIIDAVHSGELLKASYGNLPILNLTIPESCPGVPSEILDPRKSWLPSNKTEYSEEATKMAKRFIDNFAKYKTNETDKIADAGPKI